MKRMTCCSAVVLSVLLVSVVASAQSLGDVARRQKQATNKPKATRVWTNDDIPSVRQAEPQPADAAANPDAPKADAAAKDEAAKTGDAKPETMADAKSKEAEAWKTKIAAKKGEIASLEHDLDIAQREFKLRVANYYADAGNSLRDPKKWNEESKKTQDEIAAKQAAVEKAKAELADLQEQGRKAGVPAAALE